MTISDDIMTIIHLLHTLTLAIHFEKPILEQEHAVTDIAPQIAATRDNRKLTSVFEIIGSVLAMIYAMSIAMNIGAEILGFSLLLVSSALFAGWAILDRRWTFLLLQGFYAASAIIGLIRWV